MILHTAVAGQGEPIVFLHTGLQTGSTDYESQKEYFIKHNMKVILPDLRGHGKSPNHDLNNFFIDSAYDLMETLDQLGVHKAHIVGCSLGSLVGIFFVKQYPDRVLSITLSGVMPVKPYNWTELHSQDVEFQSRLLEDKEAIRYFDQLHQSDWRQFLYMVQNENWYPFDQTGDISNIEVPILILVGEGKKDEVNGASTYRSMNQNVHIGVIPFASHLVYDEQPELFNKTLKKFLVNVSVET